MLVYRDIDKYTEQTADGHYFTADELNEHAESPFGVIWTVLDTDYSDVLALYSCREIEDEVNTKGQTENEVLELLRQKRSAEIDEHDAPIMIK